MPQRSKITFHATVDWIDFVKLSHTKKRTEGMLARVTPSQCKQTGPKGGPLWCRSLGPKLKKYISSGVKTKQSCSPDVGPPILKRCSNDIQTIFKRHSNDIQTIFKRHSNDIRTTFEIYSNGIRPISKPYPNDIPKNKLGS